MDRSLGAELYRKRFLQQLTILLPDICKKTTIELRK